MDNNATYDTAFSNLRQIVDEIEDENIQLDTLADKVMRANELIQYCESKLRIIEGDVRNALG